MNPESIIFIIDDDPDFSCLLQVALREAGVTQPVEILVDGQAAIERLRSFRSPRDAMPALVLLDMKMPGLNGLEVLSWIRTQASLGSVPVALLTGIQKDDECNQALALGASSLHLKPFTYFELLQEVKLLRDSYLKPEQLQHAA